MALYIVIQNKWTIFKRNIKNTKIAKGAYAFKVFAGYYNVETLNSFKPELLLKDIEYAIRKNIK